MPAVFLYGTLCHPPLLRQVLGFEAKARAAVLPGFAVHLDAAEGLALIRPEPGGMAEGVVIDDPGAAGLARLDWYAAIFGYRRGSAPVQEGGTSLPAIHYSIDDRAGQVAHGVWSLERWLRDDGGLAVAAAVDLMALFPGPVPVLRREARRVRASSRLRAEGEPAPTAVRRDAAVTDTATTQRREPYAHFFAIEEYDLTWRRFDGSFGPVATRAAFVSGDAVTVLPYDPVRDRVLLVEQFRAGPFARGDRQPWQLEPIAGRIDPGETPEEAARREAVEEAGLWLGDLLPIAAYYPSPGAKSEFLYSYLALTDLPDGCAIIGGEESEAEDIRGHLVGFEALMGLVASGEAACAPLILSALWLQRERARLRGGR
ncbi:MAG: NUDIX domain-containing protein [Pseudorhodobacter sp.]